MKLFHKILQEQEENTNLEPEILNSPICFNTLNFLKKKILIDPAVVY